MDNEIINKCEECGKDIDNEFNRFCVLCTEANALLLENMKQEEKKREHAFNSR